MEAETKLIKSKSIMTNSFSLQKTNQTVTRQDLLSQNYIYIYIYQSANPVRRLCKNSVLYGTETHTRVNCIWNQYFLLRRSMGDKQNDVVIVNPNNKRENTKMHIHTPWVHADSRYTYVQTYTYIEHIYQLNTGQEIVL